MDINTQSPEHNSADTKSNFVRWLERPHIFALIKIMANIILFLRNIRTGIWVKEKTTKF